MVNDKVAKILKNTFVILEESGAREDIVKAFDFLSKLVRDKQIDFHKEEYTPKKKKNVELVPELSNDELCRLDTDGVEAVLKTPITKKYLDRIAVIRFNFSPSQLTRTSKSQIMDLIGTAIQNEKTHDAIGRLASGLPTKDTSEG